MADRSDVLVGLSALVVEDDPGLSAVIAMTLRAAGMSVECTGDGRTVRSMVQEHDPDVVVLDLRLPGMSGLEVCRRLRLESDVPVVVVSALDATADVVAGLENGADDYITKPFEAVELLARLRAVLRRAGPGDPQQVLSVSGLEVDLGSHQVRLDGRELNLTSTELRLLVELMRRAPRVVSREVLLEAVWGYDFLGESRVVDMAVRRLRNKLEADPGRPALVATVRGAGYRLAPP